MAREQHICQNTDNAFQSKTSLTAAVKENVTKLRMIPQTWRQSAEYTAEHGSQV